MNNNPLFNMFGGTNGMGNMNGNNANTPFGNLTNLMNSFNQFRQTFNGTPQSAQQQVQQMLNSGQINQNQLNSAIETAKALSRMMGMH